MRRGVVIIEVLIGCSLLAVVLGLCVQLLAATAHQRRDAERRAIALQQAANLMERVSAIPYDELTEERLAEIALPEGLGPILPGAAARLVVDDEPGDLPAKRVRVEITCTTRGRAEPLARLSYWAYPDSPGAQP